MQVWILTFNRPKSLNRLIRNLGFQGIKSNIWSNHPVVSIAAANASFVEQVYVNSIAHEDSTSWCARSWNSIYLKGFEKADALACFQDDTDVTENYRNWINDNSKKYDFIFGPAGDQFHYIDKKVLQKVGWWDERYNGCYCGDAEYTKRVYFEYDKNKISVEETHGWGYTINSCGIWNAIVPRSQTNVADDDYINQHTALEELDKSAEFERSKHCTNITVSQARANYFNKWGEELQDNRSVIEQYTRLMPEIDWYPWATRKFQISTYG